MTPVKTPAHIPKGNSNPMTSLKERIAVHFEAERIRRIEVAEWGEGEAPLVITYYPLTLDDLAVVSELDGSSFDKQAARIVVMKALDENGKRLFSMTDALMLRSRAAPDVVKRVAIAMLGRLTVEEAEKTEGRSPADECFSAGGSAAQTAL